MVQKPRGRGEEAHFAGASQYISIVYAVLLTKV